MNVGPAQPVRAPLARLLTMPGKLLLAVGPVSQPLPQVTIVFIVFRCS